MIAKATLSQDDIKDAISSWMDRQGYTAPAGKIELTYDNFAVKAEVEITPRRAGQVFRSRQAEDEADREAMRGGK